MNSLIELRAELKRLEYFYRHELRMNDHTHLPYMDEIIKSIEAVESKLMTNFGVKR